METIVSSITLGNVNSHIMTDCTSTPVNIDSDSGDNPCEDVIMVDGTSTPVNIDTDSGDNPCEDVIIVDGTSTPVNIDTDSGDNPCEDVIIVDGTSTPVNIDTDSGDNPCEDVIMADGTSTPVNIDTDSGDNPCEDIIMADGTSDIAEHGFLPVKTKTFRPNLCNQKVKGSNSVKICDTLSERQDDPSGILGDLQFTKRSERKSIYLGAGNSVWQCGNRIVKAFANSLDPDETPRSERGVSSGSKLFAIWIIIRDDLVGHLQHQLKLNPDLIKSKDVAGNSPIHVAAKYNKVRSLAVLFHFNADPNVSGPYDMYPLHLAAKYNSLDVAGYLLKYGANILCRDCKQKTPLHHAARKGNLDMMKLLLGTEGCQMDCRDEDHLTPLHEACQLKQPHIAKYLIEQGADTDACDISNGTPLLFAAAEGLTDIIDLILLKTFKWKGISGKAMVLNHVDNEGTSALHLAVQNNKSQVIDLLLDHGIEINLQNNTNHTPLHMAVITGNIAVVTQLLEHGADLEARDGDHMTPVHKCAMYGKMEVLEVLQQKGANMNARTSEQLTPLLVASWKGHLHVVEFLLSNRAKVAATDSCMRTALHWAVDQGHYNIMQVLMKYGGQTLLPQMDHTDQTVGHYAARTGNTMILRLLMDFGINLEARDQDGKTPLHVAAEYGNYTSVEMLVEASRSEINDGDSDGRTPLMIACLSGHLKAARSLLALGADNSIRDENYCTAMILAASKGHSKVMQLLIDDLAEVNVCDKLKNTSLHMCASGGHVEAVRLLLDRNASPVLLNSYNKSPLEMALDYQQTEVAIVMMQHTKWPEIMSLRDSEGFTPMRNLIKKAPEAALVVMDNCVSESDHRKDDINYSLMYNYQYIDPGPDDACCKDKRFFALDTMIQFNREELLSHPLTQSLLIMKWRKFGSYILYINLFIYVIYVATLNIYMTLMPSIATNVLDNIRQCPVFLTEEEATNETIVNMKKEEGHVSTLDIRRPGLAAMQLILQVFILMLLLKELFLLWGQKWRYIINPYTYLNWIMMVSTLFFINPPNLYPCVINWRAAWISSFCAWTLLISYLQRLDVVGIYFVMFSQVMFSIGKVMLVLVLFLVAFAQAFNAVLAQRPGFRDNDFFPLTILAMTLGEVNYIDMFVESNNYPFTVDSYIIIAVFMIMMPIALINLLIGVAVGDIDKIQKQAYIRRIALQSDQVNASENRFPKFLQRKVYQRYFTIKPNEEKNTKWARLKYYMFGIKTSVEFITQSEKDFTMETLQDIQKNVHKTRTRLNEITTHFKHQQDLLRTLCEHFHIEINKDADNLSFASERTDIPGRAEL